MKISPVKAFSRAKHKTTSQKVAVTDLVVATPIKSPNEDDETPNDAEKKVAGKTPDLDNKTPSDKGEEEDAPSLEESEPKIESIKVVYTIQKSSTGKPSFTKQYKVSMDNNELEVQGVTFLDTDYTRNGRNNYEVLPFVSLKSLQANRMKMLTSALERSWRPISKVSLHHSTTSETSSASGVGQIRPRP